MSVPSSQRSSFSTPAIKSLSGLYRPSDIARRAKRTKQRMIRDKWLTQSIIIGQVTHSPIPSPFERARCRVLPIPNQPRVCPTFPLAKYISKRMSKTLYLPAIKPSTFQRHINHPHLFPFVFLSPSLFLSLLLHPLSLLP